VKLDKAAWTRLIAESKTKTPGRISTDTYADLLAQKVRRLFPSDALAHSLSTINIGAAAANDAGAKALANRFAGMQVGDVLKDEALSGARRTAEIERRVTLVNRFFADNHDVLGTDLAAGSVETKGLKFDAGATDQDRAMVLATARMYQRALTVTDGHRRRRVARRGRVSVGARRRREPPPGHRGAHGHVGQRRRPLTTNRPSGSRRR
jgi:hypothetical protein